MFALAAACFTAGAQVPVFTNSIIGKVRFSNVNPDILALLNPPFGEGITNLDVLANSVPPANATYSRSELFSSTPGLSIDYSVIVDAENLGIAYNLAPRAYLLNGAEVYYFTNIVSDPVVFGGPPVTVDFNECVGVVTVHFINELGLPVGIDGVNITADGETTAVLDVTSPNLTSQRIYLGGGRTHQLSIKARQGTDTYSNLIEAYLLTNVVVTCDALTDIQMMIPADGSLATVHGTFHVAGEFEFELPARTDLNEPGYSAVIAEYGPFFNQRWAKFSGTNFSAPSSGPFTLANLPPTVDDPTIVGYYVYAQAAFRTNRQVNVFRTPILGYGVNPPLEVDPSTNLDLGNLFVIHPGYIRGAITLTGPGETADDPSGFRAIIHSGDDTTDGIPTYLNTYGVYWSSIEAEGVDQRAPGATYSASGGYGTSDFDGAVDAATGTFNGSYEVVVGGLNGESSLWTRDYLNLTFSSSQTNRGPYYDATLSLQENAAPALQVDPGNGVTNDLSYCFGEVTVTFRSPAGSFYAPTLKTLTAPGFFKGTNSLGQLVDYSVSLAYASGLPLTSDQATNVGQVTVYLPQGTYTLNPSVTSTSGQQATGLQPITLTVGCGQRISLETCLQLNLVAPSCASTNVVPISGSVRSCGNQVTQISYTLNGGAPVIVCADCGADPTFAFGLDLSQSAECNDNILVVTATDILGGVSSVSTHLFYDLTAPVIQCPNDMVVTAPSTNGIAVTFAPTANDNCAGMVAVTSIPPSGSIFPIGTNSVVCTAIDGCGNVSHCSFNVIVNNANNDCVLAIVPAVQVTWPCVGTLQSSTDPSGPWTDIPGAASPYYAPVGPTPTFFRVRN